MGPTAVPLLSLHHAVMDIVCFAWLLSQAYNRLSSRPRCCVVQTDLVLFHCCSGRGGISTSDLSFQQRSVSWHHLLQLLLAFDGLCMPGVQSWHLVEAESHSLFCASASFASALNNGMQ